MSTNRSFLSSRVVWPMGQFISPGPHTIKVEMRYEVEQWFYGELCGQKIETETIEHLVRVPDPGVEQPETEHSWPLRGSFEFQERTWSVVRDDDCHHWGYDNGRSLDKAEWLERLMAPHRQWVRDRVADGWWDIDAQGNPLRLAMKMSIAELQAEGKVLMAHLMVDLKFFSSVSQAKKNGWDKPLELGRHELGSKKKRVFIELLP